MESGSKQYEILESTAVLPQSPFQAPVVRLGSLDLTGDRFYPDCCSEKLSAKDC